MLLSKDTLPKGAVDVDSDADAYLNDKRRLFST